MVLLRPQSLAHGLSTPRLPPLPWAGVHAAPVCHAQPAGGGGQQQPTDTGSTAHNSNNSSETVQVQFRGVTISVRKGSKLRTALLKSGLTPHNGDARLINCRGLGTCGTCAVQISGPVQPATWTAMEAVRLNLPPHAPPASERLRLACQVRCQGDLQVTKYNKFWGQGSVPLADLTFPPTQTNPATNQGTQGTEGAQAGPASPGGSGSAGRQGGVEASEPQSVLGVGLTPLGRLEFILDRDTWEPPTGQ